MDPGTAPDASGSYRIPLLVGVVGSRNLAAVELAPVRAAIRELLLKLRETQPQVRVQLLCSLADGTDLLAAEVAAELAVDIVALLPFSAEVCRAALASDAARASFDRVLERAERLEVSARELAHPGDTADGEPRKRMAALIALYSSLLIVVWDGSDGDDSTTAGAVDQRLGRAGPSGDERVADPHELLFAEDNDLMYEILRKQANAANGLRITGFTTGRRDFGNLSTGIPPALLTLLERTAAFNGDVAEHAESISVNGRHLLPESASGLPETLAYVDSLFACADWLGVHFRRSYLRALKARYALWAILVALLLLYDNHPGGLLGFASIGGVLIVLALTALLAGWAKRRRWHRRFLDYRALAEGLRVEFYWELGGVRMQFDGAFAHESFLQKQDNELEWIRAAMRAVSLRCARYPRGAVADGLARTAAAWVGERETRSSGQLSYYRERADRLAKREKIAERCVRVLLLSGLSICCVLALDAGLGLAGSALLTSGWRVLLVAVFALVTAYGAIFGIYFDERSDRALIHQYRHMDALFTFAARQLQSARSNEEKLAILRSLGQACLTEHAQWILAHRDKRIEGMKW